jgi:hypothetical protein
MNKTQKAKRNFRASKIWKAFRHQKHVEQKGIDPITKKKLRKYWNLHHRHVSADTDEYQDISNPEHYVCLNSATHDALHWIYRYWKDDPDILKRIELELESWY